MTWITICTFQIWDREWHGYSKVTTYQKEKSIQIFTYISGTTRFSDSIDFRCNWLNDYMAKRRYKSWAYDHPYPPNLWRFWQVFRLKMGFQGLQVRKRPWRTLPAISRTNPTLSYWRSYSLKPVFIKLNFLQYNTGRLINQLKDY